MNRILRYAVYGLITAFGVLISLGAYARIWEARQAKQHILKPKVRSIEPYSSTNDLHWSFREYRVHIVGEDKPK